MDSVLWHPDLPGIDMFDHAKSELPNLDCWSFGLAGSNNGISPGLPVPDQHVNNSTHLSQPLAAPVANRLPELVDEATGVRATVFHRSRIHARHHQIQNYSPYLSS